MRPQALSKLGYYPTPEKTSQELEAIISSRHSGLLAPSTDPDQDEEHPQRHSPIAVLDPCCGTGEALRKLAEHLLRHAKPDSPATRETGVMTYGVEPNTERHQQASLILDHAVNAPIEQCQIPNESFDAMLLNPPYDYDNEHDYNRLETYFLSITTPALRPGGLLVYIIPQYVVPDAADLLATNYTNVEAYRMSDPDYRRFGQSIIIARREKHLDSQLPQPWVVNHLNRHADLDDYAPSLAEALADPEHRKYHFEAAPTDAGNRPSISRTSFNPQSILRAADRQSALHTKDVTDLLVPAMAEPPFRPLEPLRRGHVCLLAANGQLDNIPIFDDQGVLDPVIIKGRSVKRLVDVEQDDEAKTTTAQENFEARITVMNLKNGEVSIISENVDDLTAFFACRQDSIDQAVRERYRPAIDPMDPKYERMRRRVAQLKRTLLGKQAPSSIVVAAQLRAQGHCFGVGQQGSGKTTLAIAAAHAAEFRTILVVTPTHNVQTWADEIKETHPNARVRVVNAIGRRGIPDTSTFKLHYAETDLETIRSTPADPDHPVYAIMGRDGQNKLTYPFRIISRTISNTRPLYRTFQSRDANGPTFKTASITTQQRLRQEQMKRGQTQNMASVPRVHETCPNCWVPFRNGKDYPTGRQASCHACGFHLAAPDVKGNNDRIYARARYVGKHMPEWADLFIIDEAHQFRGRSSAQAEVYGALAQRSKRTLALTGTLIGGKASECFRLLASMSPPFYDRFGFHDRKQFTETYGRYEIVFETQEYGPQVGKRSNRRAMGRPPKELNGFHPAMMNLFWPNTVFMRITDIKRDLPEPEVYVHLCDLDEQPLANGNGATSTQKDSYEVLEKELKEHLLSYLKDRRMEPLGQYLQELLTYPENGWQGTAPIDPDSAKTGNPTPIVVMPPLPEDYLYPKEIQMLEIVNAEVKAGRKVLIYVTHTRRRNTAKRIHRLLQKRLIRARIMPDGNAKGRLRWIQQAAATTDVIICHPRKVETGLNLLDFPTILWYEHDPSMYTVEQASARSHRANQTKTVRIHHMAYANTMQERYLRLIAEKADTSRMIYGELGANGLSAFNPNSQELRQVIAREMMRSTPADADSHIDVVSSAISNLMVQDREDIEAIFRANQRSHRNANQWAATELHQGEYFSLGDQEQKQERPSRLATPDDPAPETEPVTWDQWRQSQNIKARGRQPDNQIVLL